MTRCGERWPLSLVVFAKETNAIVTAEGIETSGEFATLHDLGVPWGQGFFLDIRRRWTTRAHADAHDLIARLQSSGM